MRVAAMPSLTYVLIAMVHVRRAGGPEVRASGRRKRAHERPSPPCSRSRTPRSIARPRARRVFTVATGTP
jgi:hypothetical protein